MNFSDEYLDDKIANSRCLGSTSDDPTCDNCYGCVVRELAIELKRTRKRALRDFKDFKSRTDDYHSVIGKISSVKDGLEVELRKARTALEAGDKERKAMAAVGEIVKRHDLIALDASGSPDLWLAEEDGTPHRGSVKVYERSVDGFETVAHFYCGARTGHGATNAKLAAASRNAVADLIRLLEDDE